jgi:GT2 family glycosyltransferase
MEPFLVSTVIVTWNRKDDVAAAVQSAYDQTYPDVEDIVDNGSTDGTVAALPETTRARRSSRWTAIWAPRVGAKLSVPELVVKPTFNSRAEPKLSPLVGESLYG